MRRWLIGEPVVAVVVAVVVIVAALFGLQVLRISHHVAIPAADANPPAVVDAYLAALNAHDCATAKALWDAPDSPASRWCASVTHVRPADAPDEAKAAVFGPGGNTVTLGLSVRERLFHGDDSLPSSPFSWTFFLRHTVAGWRIVDEGQG